jgi:peptidoglycan/xylan/chitin deacetylase (PgdA/CDA1 family)
MLHRTRPAMNSAYQPNKGLEITPQFLDEMLGDLKERGFRFVSMHDVHQLLKNKKGPRFIALTADDGYRDNIEYGLPVLRKHNAPMMIYISTGFARRTSNLWWLDLEAAIRKLKAVSLEISAKQWTFECCSPKKKTQTFKSVLSMLRSQPESLLREKIDRLRAEAGIDWKAIVETNCLSVDEIVDLSKTEPLISFGSHTVNHLMLRQHEMDLVKMELDASKREIESWTGKPTLHLAYPVGDRVSVGTRDAKIAESLGYETGVTAQGGVLAGNEYNLLMLPRIYVSGDYATTRGMRVQASGRIYALRSLLNAI